MRFARWVLPAVVAAAACSSSNDAPDEPSIPCSYAETGDRMTDVRVYVDPALPPEVRADLGSYLARMWGAPAPIEVIEGGAPAGASAIVFSLDPATKGYAIRRDGTQIVASADTKEDLVAAAYATLEELGVRFFHPMEELVPVYDGPRFPASLDVRRTPWVKTRGLQIHVLHPLEYLRTLQEAGDGNLAEAKKLVDWLVKNGMNYLQWPLLRTVDWPSFADHARKIIAYAHSRGVTVGSVVQLSLKAATQNNYVLVRDEATYEDQIKSGLTQLMDVPWDDVELGMGEFLAGDPESLVKWLNVAVDHLATIAPSTLVAVQNHVGNYPNLYSTFRGVPNTYFYQVPKYADARLGQTVHTIFWFDLFRPGGMYGHEDFAFQRSFIFEELAAPEQRRVRYYPESAYWIAQDIDVPAFFPEFIESRWTDIHRLDEDIQTQALRPLDGHTLYTSGHEWGYWLTDYLTAKMLWDPKAPLDRFTSHYTAAYGSCAPDMQTSFTRFIELQRTILHDQNLWMYVSGEDNAVDLGALIGFQTRPPRKKFDDLVTGDEPSRAAFEATVLAPLDTFVAETKPLEDDAAARCRGMEANAPAMVPWCLELRDGYRIVRIRLEHTLALYRAILAYARGDHDGAKQRLADAMAITERAKTAIEEREKHYRFDVGRLTDAYSNPTNYAFGYLRQAHTQCFYRRQDEQARRIIEEDLIGSKPTGLPSCLD